MKRFLSLFCAVLLLCLFAGCAGIPNPARELQASEFAKVEAYTGSVPADATRKTITDAQAIQSILSALQALRIQRQASDEDLLAGGIGISFRFTRPDGTTVVAHNHENLFSYQGGELYVVSGRSLSTEDFWNELPGEEVPVDESELP